MSASWTARQPQKPGWYVLEFDEGERFVVALAFQDENATFRLEDQNTKGYISDPVSRHLCIPSPP